MYIPPADPSEDVPAGRHIMASVHCDLGGVGERPFTPVDERAPFMPARATKRVTGYAHIPARHRRAPTPLPPRSAGRCSQKTHDGLSASGADNPAAAHTASGPTSTTSTSICPLSTAIVSSRLVSSQPIPSSCTTGASTSIQPPFFGSRPRPCSSLGPRHAQPLLSLLPHPLPAQSGGQLISR